ncbi:MAG: sulfurtransferase complex subunit TusB [Gammaproteobacteria bacterium]|nr:sulfurtransferase complex subunit TusB [Gammaproteobacteria bacterium]
MLHTVNKSPLDRNNLDSCMSMAKKGSKILLIEDAVIGAMDNTAVAEKIKGAMNDFSFYVLGPDLQARGLDEGKVIGGINVVGYDGYVDLVTETDNVQSWV